ncbi:RDD family protein [Aureivirga sp. CE67]|uniref:RDD family protein n=1 Tax=Aureivirga sp. CE67 TaxID=1788983 RepID=UPI0018CACC74|nr:RDD family protein [Aureivirga sp. CE67]
MERFQIQTAHNITISQNIAPPTKRIGASLIDLLIIAVYSLVMLYLINDLNLTNNFFVITICTLPAMLFTLVYEILSNGKTPGKTILNLRVVQINGDNPTIINFILRWLLRIIDIFTAVGSVALLSVLFSKKGQRLGDFAADTTVIYEKETITLKDTLATNIEENYVPLYPQVISLSAKDVETIKSIYNQSLRGGDYNTILKIHNRVLEITGIETNEKPVAFIPKIVKDYNYYTQL